jgi:hypothetical protein
VAAVNQPIEERGRHLLEAYDQCPLGKGKMRSESHAGSFIAIAEKLEEQLCRWLGKRQVARSLFCFLYFLLFSALLHNVV